MTRNHKTEIERYEEKKYGFYYRDEMDICERRLYEHETIESYFKYVEFSAALCRRY